MREIPQGLATVEFAAQVNGLYVALMAHARAGAQEEPSLGGQLLFAGELNAQGRAMVVAANIAGAASLAATADPMAQKQAVRDGVADFLVTTLDEALRILKNEVRKRETVAVCVAAAPQAVEREMLERGVLPDLLPPGGASNEIDLDTFLKQGARCFEVGIAPQGGVLVAWQVSSAPARWLPLVDAIALEYLELDDLATRRWLRLAPRYLGRLAQGVRVARFGSAAAQGFRNRVEEAVESGAIGAEVSFRAVNA